MYAIHRVCIFIFNLDAVCYQMGQHIEMHSESVPDLDGAVFVLRPVFSSIGSSSSFATGQVTVESRGMVGVQMCLYNDAWYILQILINTTLKHNILNIFLPVSFKMCFWCSKQLSHRGCSFEYS